MLAYKRSLTWIVAIVLLAAIVMMTGCLWLAVEAYSADVAPPCLTREQARKKFPKQWLYWHGKQRCWDNKRGGGRGSRAERRRATAHVEEPAPTRVEPPSSKPMPVYYPHILRFPPDHPPNPPHQNTMSMLPIPPEATSKQPIRDFAPWQWSSEAYAAQPDLELAPSLPTQVNRDAKGSKEEPRQPSNAARVTADMVMVLLVMWLLCFMIGATLYRWAEQRNELKLKRRYR